MREDPHLGTGSYDPATYWSARARRPGSGRWDSVCVFDASPVENLCADRVQTRSMLRGFRRLGIAGKRVLEYGCGIGRWAPRVGGLGATWAGVDLSAEMCARARESNPDVDIQQLVDGRTIPHQPASFDVVYSVTVLHHNEHAAQERILDEMLRVLKPGGALVLLEDLGTDGSFNMFPRSHQGWIDVVQSRGPEFVESERMRYWVLRGALAAMRRRAAPGGGPSPQSAVTEEPRTAPAAQRPSPPPKRGPLRRLVDRVDAWVDPWLQPLLPASACTAARFTFRKP